VNEKNIEKSAAMEAPAAQARAHNAGDGAVGAGAVGRFSAQRKLVAVQPLLRGVGGAGKGIAGVECSGGPAVPIAGPRA